jgi:stage V sporulation protein D (sporulation-specific penicillin-binding protein)
MRNRLFGVIFTMSIAAAAYITFNLFGTAVINSEYYKAKANSQQLSAFIVNANRGTMFDTNGKILAHSLTVWDVIIAPNVIKDNKENYQKLRQSKAKSDYEKAVNEGLKNIIPPDADAVYDEEEEICRALSDILDIEYNEMKDLCKDTSLQFQIVKTKVEKEKIDKINEFKEEKLIGTYCVYTIENAKRNYPNDSLASNIIGFTNYDNEGVYGIEAYYDDYLQGVNGKIEIATDATGNAMPYEHKANYAAQNGNSLYLTIDEVLQHYLEKNLETTVSQHLVNNRATGIIMNPKTGAVYAMATYPNFNLNEPSELNPLFEQKMIDAKEQLITDTLVANGFTMQSESDKLSPAQTELIDGRMKALRSVARETQWKNKAVTELYFPGSVFKVITCASALEEQAVSLDSHFYCAGHTMVGGEKINCWNPGGHGSLNLLQAITKSCNPAFMDIGSRLGREKFSDYFEAFGFTEKTGIDLPGEAESLYMPRDRMGVVELASCSFGQTNKITPIQMITAYAAAINGGYLVTPYVVDKVVDNNGNIIKSAETMVKRQVISGETSAQMRDILEQVVKTNGGTNAYIAGYRIGGKSGTTEKLDEYPPTNMRYVSTFCAFTPADDPEIIMLVCIDEPMSGVIYGSAVAAPVVSSVFKECLTYMEIYPQYTAEEQAAQDIAVPQLKGLAAINATTTLNAAGLKADFIGEDNGGKVLYTVPQAGQKISRGGTVVAYLSEQDYVMGTVPDVRGMDITQANNAITNAGLNISLSGGAVENQNARATIQSIAPGTSVAVGTVVEVMFILVDDGY